MLHELQYAYGSFLVHLVICLGLLDESAMKPLPYLICSWTNLRFRRRKAQEQLVEHLQVMRNRNAGRILRDRHEERADAFLARKPCATHICLLNVIEMAERICNYEYT